MRWVAYVARIGDVRNGKKKLSENLKGKGHSVDLGFWGIILELILGKQAGKVWT
jgi:hypothetical protein